MDPCRVFAYIYTYYGIRRILMILASNSCMPLRSIHCTPYYTGHFVISIHLDATCSNNLEPEVTESFQVPDGKVFLACSFTCVTLRSQTNIPLDKQPFLGCFVLHPRNQPIETRVVPPVFLRTKVDILKLQNLQNSPHLKPAA